MATTRSSRFWAVTIFIFCSGVVRANTRTPCSSRSTRPLTVSARSSSPVQWVVSPTATMPAAAATARAVAG